MLYGICMSILVIMMFLLQPYKSKRVNNYQIVLMLILAIMCFLCVLVSQSKAYWISYTLTFLIGLLAAFPLLYAIAYAIINYTPCRRFKQYWKKLPKSDDDPELESLLQTNNED